MLVSEGIVVASEMAAQFKLRLRTELEKAPASDRQFWGPAELLSWCVGVLANDPSIVFNYGTGDAWEAVVIACNGLYGRPAAFSQ
jgi:hypothetical protein